VNMQRYPCNNCQQYGHWKYMPECPNFHLYLASQQAALDAFRSGASGGNPATGADPAAVVPYTGTGTYRLLAYKGKQEENNSPGNIGTSKRKTTGGGV
jgi:hypothetical protein